MRPLFSVLLLISFLAFTGCQSVQQSMKNARVDDQGVMDITLSDINKDALRVKGTVVKSNGLINKRNSYDLKIEEIVKYGATFSSAEPEVGEVVNLETPKDISFEEGQTVIIDVLTPKFGQPSKPMKVSLGQP